MNEVLKVRDWIGIQYFLTQNKKRAVRIKDCVGFSINDVVFHKHARYVLISFCDDRRNVTLIRYNWEVEDYVQTNFLINDIET